MIRFNVVKLRQNFCLFFFFVSMFAFMPTNLHTDRLVWMFSSVLLLGSTVWDLLRKRIRLYLYNSYLLYLFVILWGMASILWSAQTEYLVNYLTIKFPFITLSVFCVSAYMSDEKQMDHSFRMMIAAACTAALRFSIYTSWTDYRRGDFGYLLDVNTNYNSYTTPLCLAFVIAAYYALVKKERIMLAAAAFLAAILLIAGSRKTIVVIPIILFLYLFSQRNMKRFVQSALIALIALAIGLYALMNWDLLEGIRNSLVNGIRAYLLGESADIGKSSTDRMYLIETAKQIWSEHPWLGVGWNNFRRYNYLALYSHNNYYEMLVCLGIVGFVLYYSMYVRALFIELQYAVARKSKDFSKLVLGIIICMLILEVGSVIIYSREAMMILLIVLAMQEKGLGKKLKVLTLG